MNPVIILFIVLFNDFFDEGFLIGIIRVDHSVKEQICQHLGKRDARHFQELVFCHVRV